MCPSRSVRALAVVLITAATACASDDAARIGQAVGTQPDVAPAATSSTPALIPTPSTAISDSTEPSTTRPTTTVPTTKLPASTLPATTLPASSSTTTTSTTTPPPSQPGPIGTLDINLAVQTIGVSKQGRPIVAERFGTPDGRRVLVIGVIHGNEDAGVAIIEELRTQAVPEGVDLWLVESMNPDGQFAQVRQNANGVDLNRNFPHDWGPIGDLGDSQYAGPSAASEPETQTMVSFIEALRPDIAIWYHQDANLVIPSTGRDGRIRARYAELTGLPIADCCGGGGIYTGIAATWARTELKRDSDAVPFIVELPGGDLDAIQIEQHTNAVLTIADEG